MSAPRSDPSENVAEPRFKSCRWHETQDNGSAYCGNRDVLPFAGKNGFNPDAWCPECKLYKLKRTTKEAVDRQLRRLLVRSWGVKWALVSSTH